MNAFSLKDKTILITGSSGKLGQDLSKRIIKNGGDVIGVDKVKSDLDKFLELDFTKISEFVKIAEYLEEKKIEVDGLVLAHQAKPEGFLKNSIENFDYELWKEILSVNLDATFFIIQELLKSKMNKNLSSIVLCGSTYANVSSNPALYKENELGNPIAYSASKGGIVSLTRYLSVHLAKKDIRVNCISPHGIENNQSDNFQKKFSELSPISRLSRVEETSYPIIFLLSEASSYITGSNLIVDGGWTSW